MATCRDAASPSRPHLTPLASVTSNVPEVFVGAGDIAECVSTNDEATANLLDGIAGTVFTLGDNAYETGSLTDFQNCYEPSWGRHKARTHPVPGNHDTLTAGLAGYYQYFGAAAGEAGKGFYSYDLGEWHIVALNNYIPVGAGSEQLTWLQNDLAATTKPCILGYWHEPLYSSGTGIGSGGDSSAWVRPLFQALYNAGADVVLSGHRHFYERLSPMNPLGQLDAANGIRQFVVGTGGSEIGNPTNAHPLSEIRFGSTNFGLLKMYLYSDSYAWRFVPVPGKTLSDTGLVACHGVSSGVSPSHSTVTASPSLVPLAGTSTITVTVRDASGQPIPGATVQLSVSPEAGSTLTQPAAPTGADGVAEGTLRADNATQKIVTATVTLGGQTTALPQSATVTVSSTSSLAHTLLTAGSNPANQSVYTTASISPAPNALVTVAVMGRSSGGAAPSPVITGGGMSAWTVVGTTAFDTRTTPTRRVTIYRAMSASPGSGPLTITFSATQSNAQWIVSQWSGVDASGTNGSGAIVQVGSANTDAATSLNVALNPFAHVNNVAYGAFGVKALTAVVEPGAGFTEISEQPPNETTHGDLQAEWRTNDNTVDATWGTTNLPAGAVALEIQAVGAGDVSVNAGQSSVTVSPATIVAGTATTTITVTARNAVGAAVSGAVVQIAATGSGNTISTPAPTDPNGVTTATLSSTVAETKVITVTANSTQLVDQPSVEVRPAAVSATGSTVTATPTTIPADTGASTITVVVKDQFANPINGATVTLSASPAGGVTFTQPGSTDAGGFASGDLRSSVAGTKTVTATVTVGATSTVLSQTPAITVTAPQSGGTITHTLLTAGSQPANLTVYTTASIAPAPNALVTIAVMGRVSGVASPSPVVTGGGMTAWTEVGTTAFDMRADPQRRLTVYRAMSASPGSGPLTITFSAKQSNAQWIVSQWGGVDGSGTNGSGAIVQVGTANTDGATGLNVALNAFANVNNVAYGAFGVKDTSTVIAPGAGFTELAEQPSLEATAADLQAEWSTNDATIDASWATSLRGGAVGLEIRAGSSGGGGPQVDPNQSTIAAAPATITAGGTGATVTVTARSSSGTPLPNVLITLQATGTGNTLSAPGMTNSSGVYQGALSSTKAEAKVITASAQLSGVTTQISGSANVTVAPAPPSASQSTLTASPLSITAGTGTSTITVRVKDAFANDVPGATVTLSATGTGNTLSAPGATNASGVYTGSLASTVAEQKVVSAQATVGGQTTSITQTATVTVVPSGPGPVSATQSTVAANPTTINQGTGSSTITVTVRDAANTPIPGATVTLSATGTGNTLSAPGVTNGSGVYTGSLSSTVAEQKVVSAQATVGGQTTNITQTATVTVVASGPGPVSATQSTVAANPTTINQGTGSSTITVTVRDAANTPIPGATV
ncbi:MAG TPA: Ig-like domain-containing protein, partial [Gemmatimonadales bacterium]|nr:Ig-like domain-containing protein [Gemmatimonadales bacterium]